MNCFVAILSRTICVYVQFRIALVPALVKKVSRTCRWQYGTDLDAHEVPPTQQRKMNVTVRNDGSDLPSIDPGVVR